MHKNNYKTIRATVPALEELFFEPIKILDHGFIRVIDYMGDDSSIAQAAQEYHMVKVQNN